MDKKYWIVICPDPHVKGGLWPTWYDEGCVAIGWDPDENHSLSGLTDDAGWKLARDRMMQMQPGDYVIPYLKIWRIGPVGTITRVQLAGGWKPTVPSGAKKEDPVTDGLGRCIEVKWWTSEMPGRNDIAITPRKLRGKGGRVALARQTIVKLSYERFKDIVAAISDDRNWEKWKAVW